VPTDSERIAELERRRVGPPVYYNGLSYDDRTLGASKP